MALLLLSSLVLLLAEAAPPNSTLTRSTRHGRILGGTSAALGEMPYLVYIESALADGVRKQHCGGALLSESTVLTAAQCVVGASAIKIVAGVSDPSDTSGQTSYGLATINPRYRKNFQINDIAIVKLLTPFILNHYVYPIKLAKKTSPKLDHVNLRIGGWGSVDSSSTIQTSINTVQLRQLTKKECSKQTQELFVSYPAMTACLESSQGENGFCYGDSGGPVTYTFPDEVDVSLVGILSQYQYCPNAYPMSYTRVGPFTSWIKKIVKRLLKS